MNTFPRSNSLAHLYHPLWLVAASMLALTFLLFFSSADADTLLFQSYTQRDGLAANYVTSIAFGRDGATWVGTSRGVTRVLDKSWVSYTANNGLGNSWVSGIAGASDDKVYVATNSGGLTVFDGANRKTYNTDNSKIPSNYLTSVVVDKQNRVWIGTLGFGVARLENDQWANFSLVNNFANALTMDSANNVWVATNDGAMSFDGKMWATTNMTSGLASNRVSTLATAPDGKIWFGTDNGVSVYDGKLFHTYKKSDGLGDNVVRAIAVDATRTWVGTARGLSVLENGKWKTYTRADGLLDDDILALAIDARGNVWVGTARGLSIFGGAKLQLNATLPVVLVHGWHTADSDNVYDTEFHYIKRYLELDGFSVFYAQGISPYRTLFQNAETLRDVIASVKKQTGASQVDVIAFSMGGLNTRSYLESTLYQNDVRRAIILGTPMSGVSLWYPLLTREIEERPTEPSVIELTPEYAALFNRTHAPRTTVPYDLLVGDARTQTGLELLKVFPASDGLIDAWSALSLSGNQVRRILNNDVHAWDPYPIPLNITSYLYPDQTYLGYIRNALRDPDVKPMGLPAPTLDAIAPRNITPMNVDVLRAGNSVTRTIAIDANRGTRFLARWIDGGDVDMTLRAPTGITYTIDTPRDSTALKADIGNFIGYSITNTMTGTWSLNISRLDKGMTPITITTYADLDSDARLNVATNKTTYALGESVVISATMSNKITGSDARAYVEWLGDGKTPRGQPVEIKLTESNLGVYASAVNGLQRGGYYLVRVVVRGNGFAREQQTIFSISPETAKFAGQPKVRVQGTPGKYSALVVQVDVNATRAGDFALAATVRARDQIVASLTMPMKLKSGLQTASIEIPGRDIRASGMDGAYNVTLVLMDASWTAVQTDETKPITTDAYRATDFE
jgi:sugar lactone lactonase YvrE/pimeloyl-ACP methyl ester carboxylesterase